MSDAAANESGSGTVYARRVHHSPEQLKIEAEAFTAFCGWCGGTQLVQRVRGEPSLIDDLLQPPKREVRDRDRRAAVAEVVFGRVLRRVRRLGFRIGITGDVAMIVDVPRFLEAAARQ